MLSVVMHIAIEGTDACGQFTRQPFACGVIPINLVPKFSKEVFVSNKPEGIQAATSMEVKLKYGGLVAVIVVLIYLATSLYLIYSALSAQDETITSELESVYTTVGALLSATVVAILAITPPGEHPVSQLRGETWSDLDWSFGKGNKPKIKPETKQRVRKFVLDLYLSIWVILGALALIVGVMIRPGVVPVLTSAGNAWLGIAIASIYAYLGISVPGKKAGQTPG